MKRNEVAADIEQAERLGVLVRTAESLEQTLGQTLVLQNADLLFAEVSREVEERRNSRARA
jgi:hypothetical protein